jgi:hypothetical protein
MKVIKVLSVQSFFDISIQYTGSIDSAFTIAFANNRSISDDLIINESILIPLDLIASNKVLQYYSARAIIPATGLTLSQIDAMESLGIGFMVIGQNFIVE